jgi:hypothetical protein
MNSENWRNPSAILAALVFASTSTTGSMADDGPSGTIPVQGPDAVALAQPGPAGAVGAATLSPAAAPATPGGWDQMTSAPAVPDQTMDPGYGQMMDPGYGQMMDPGYGQMMDPGYGQMMTPGYGQGMTPGFPGGTAIQGQRYVSPAPMLQRQHQQRMIERLDAIVNRLERIEQVLREEGR